MINRKPLAREMPDHFLIIKENVSVIFPGAQRRGSPKGTGAWIISDAQCGTIDQHASRFNARPPWRRYDKILRPDHVESFQPLADQRDLLGAITHVVISENNLFIYGDCDAGMNSVDLII